MTTHVGRARRRVARERDAVEDKRAAYDRFRSRLESIPAPDTAGTGGTLVATASTSTVRPVREAFAETVAPVCEERPVGELLAAELGEGIATALTTDGASPPLRRAIRAEADRRRAELDAMDRALDAEGDSLDRAGETVEAIREWLIAANETALSSRGFEALSERHDRLEGFRADCETLVRDRQAHLRRTTGADGQAGVRHHDLLEYLYGGFPVEYPVLVTVTRLDGLCEECQRTVRDHLVRRV